MWSIRRSCLTLSSFAFLILPGEAFASACCGGGFALPSLIAGDEKAQLTASYAYSEVRSEVGADSLWRRRAARETGETWKLEAAHILGDRTQAGLSVPVLKRSRSGASETGLGDLSATFGYEALTDWDYHPWRPKGLAYLQLTAPTGRSVREASAPYQLDSRGRGLWAVGVGGLFTKLKGRWDFFANLSGHRSFAKELEGEVSGRLEPGYGSDLGLGTGFSFSGMRLGASLTWSYEDPVVVQGAAGSRGSVQRFTTAALSASYLFSPVWAATLSYTDQTLFGRPLSASLARGAAFLVQRRWQR